MIIIAIFIIVFVIGIMLPNPRISHNTFIIEAPIENVWDKVTDYAGQVNWRDGIEKIEVNPDTEGEWTEVPINGMPITFKETDVIKNQKYRIDIISKNGFKGYSVISFKSDKETTYLEFTEVSDISNPFQRVLSYLFYNSKSTIKKYEEELTASLLD